jgi:thioredoxin
MVLPVRPLLLGCVLMLAAALVSGCDRVRGLTNKLKQEVAAKNAAAAAPDGPQIVTLDASTYDAFIAQKGKLVIVDFYADWCGPCRMLGPMLEKAAAAHPAVVFIGRVNVDYEKSLAVQQQVRNIPDVRIFNAGQEVDRFVGCPSEPEIMDKIATLAQGITPAAAGAPATPAKSFEEAVTPMPKNWLPPGLQKR